MKTWAEIKADMLRECAGANDDAIAKAAGAAVEYGYKLAIMGGEEKELAFLRSVAIDALEDDVFDTAVRAQLRNIKAFRFLFGENQA